ncbi:hypothetical protein HGO38_10940 [Rhizobium sp. CG5]|nr:hypothetical protein [Rhizobium sp. CG5]
MRQIKMASKLDVEAIDPPSVLLVGREARIGEVGKAGEFGLEGELDGAGRSAALGVVSVAVLRACGI